MKHMGDITKIKGWDVPPVDVIIGGSPCQDLSVAGRREGLSGAHSGLFMDQIRIVKEAREADEQRGRTGQFIQPRFMVWENVPGAFSSNKGEDFRAVLEETIRIVEPGAPDIPLPVGGKWPLADCYFGNGWSVAYRVLDAQFWGVPQRRRRIALVADFGGHAAPEILFVRKSVSGDSSKSGKNEQETSESIEGSVNPTVTKCLRGCYNGIGNSGDLCPTLTATGCHAAVVAVQQDVAAILNDQGGSSITVEKEEVSPTLRSESHGNLPIVCHAVSVHQNASGEARIGAVANTLSTNGNASGRNAPLVMAPTLNCNHEQPIIAGIDCWNGRENGDLCGTLQAKENDGYSLNYIHPVRIGYTVRRLTPLECERLQGFPDGWTDIPGASDTARYRALGNSIAIPPWKWVLKRLSSQYERDATMASLFDGIGGFPYIWEQINGCGSCIWASEIEPFAIAVTTQRFRNEEKTEEAT